jgi:hypothetical protein
MGINLNLPYRESGDKTILHLALEEDDGEAYVDALLAVSKIHCRLNYHILVQLPGFAPLNSTPTPDPNPSQPYPVPLKNLHQISKNSKTITNKKFQKT